MILKSLKFNEQKYLFLSFKLVNALKYMYIYLKRWKIMNILPGYFGMTRAIEDIITVFPAFDNILFDHGSLSIIDHG
jgi:hypothetical protein